MIAAELLEHFVKEMDVFESKVKLFRDFDKKIYEDKESILFQNDFTQIYVDKFLNNIYDIYYHRKAVLKEDLEFFVDSKSKSDFLFVEIQELKEVYDDNNFGTLFTLDNFHNQFFEMDTLDILISIFIKDHEEIIRLYEDEPKPSVHLETLNSILRDDFQELNLVAKILISLKLIHIEQENDKEKITSQITPQRSDNSILTLNQKILLIDKIISTENWFNLTQKRQAELIQLITNQNIDNIKKGLRILSKKPSKRKFQEQNDIDYINDIAKDLH